MVALRRFIKIICTDQGMSAIPEAPQAGHVSGLVTLSILCACFFMPAPLCICLSGLVLAIVPVLTQVDGHLVVSIPEEGQEAADRIADAVCRKIALGMNTLSDFDRNTQLSRICAERMVSPFGDKVFSLGYLYFRKVFNS